MTVVINPNSSLDFIFRVLSIFGIWLPSSFKGTWKELAYRVYTFFIITGTYFAYESTQFTDLLVNLGDLETNIDTFSIGSCIVAASYKSLNIVFCREKIQQIRNTFESETFTHVSEENVKVMNKYTRVVRVISRVYVSSAVISIIVWCIVPLFNKSDERKMPVRTWYPWDRSVLSTYVSLYIFQVISIFIIACCNASQDVMIASFMILLCGQVDMLCCELTSLGQEHPPADETKDIAPLSPPDVTDAKRKFQNINAHLKKCIVHQQEIMECADKFEVVFNKPLFVQFLLSCMTLCIVAFLLSVMDFSVDLVGQLIYMMVLVTELSMFCYPGNELMAMSHLIPTSLYQSPWYDQDMEFKKMMITLMERSKRPIVLTAGYILPLSLETLSSILQSSYSYYLVLQYLHSGK